MKSSKLRRAAVHCLLSSNKQNTPQAHNTLLPTAATRNSGAKHILGKSSRLSPHRDRHALYNQGNQIFGHRV